MDYTILLAGNLANIYMIDSFFNCFFTRNVIIQKIWSRWGIFLGCGVLLTSMNVLYNTNINTLIFVILIMIYSHLAYSGHIIRRMIYSALSVLIIIGSELILITLLQAPYYLGADINYIKMSDIPVQYFSLKLLVLVIFSILKQMFRSSKEKIPTSLFLIYICMPLLCLTIVLLHYYSGMRFEVGSLMGRIMKTCIGLVFVGNALTFYVFHLHIKELYQKQEMEFELRKNEIDYKHMVRMEEQDKKYKEYLHNISNQLKVIHNLSSEKTTPQVDILIGDLEEDLENNEKILFSQNPIINILLSECEKTASDKNISFEAFVEPLISIGKVKESDLISILGNLLDNAMEGADTAELDRFINVKIFMEASGHMLIMKIENGFNGDVKSNKGNLLSRKRNFASTGIGVETVEQKVNKYNGGFSFHTEGPIFCAVVTLLVEP